MQVSDPVAGDVGDLSDVEADIASRQPGHRAAQGREVARRHGAVSHQLHHEAVRRQLRDLVSGDPVPGRVHYGIQEGERMQPAPFRQRQEIDHPAPGLDRGRERDGPDTDKDAEVVAGEARRDAVLAERERDLLRSCGRIRNRQDEKTVAVVAHRRISMDRPSSAG